MRRSPNLCFVIITLLISIKGFSQVSADTIVLRDLPWDSASPAGMIELTIPSNGSSLAGFMYKTIDKQKHPTLILLHGLPGNERNLDLAQVVRARGWNVLYFNYRGSWASEGKFSFKNCVEDAINVVAFCKRYSDSLQIDTSKIALLGHSLGAWVCLKVLAQLPDLKKGFAISTASFLSTINSASRERLLKEFAKSADAMFVLNKSSGTELWNVLMTDSSYFNLTNDVDALASKQIVMVDEHERNKPIAEAFRRTNKNYFSYEVWKTNHAFSNKRVALMKKLIEFLNR